MKILSTGRFFGNKRKFEELKGLTKQLKPDILLITGGLFSYDPYSPLLQSENLFDVKEYFIEYSKNCGKLLYIFGETDLACLNETFHSLLKNESNNIFCLNEENFNYNDHTFIGFPYVGNTETQLKDWSRLDSTSIDKTKISGFHSTEDFDISPINNVEDLRGFYSNKLNMMDIMEKKLKNTLKYKILISYFPPFDKGENHNYNLFLDTYIKNFDIVYINNLKDEEISITEGYNFIANGYEENFLLFNFNIVDYGNVIYNLHPYNNDMEFFNNARIYRDMTNAN
jgi:Icc-related predicted phosphoesterase